MTKLTFFWGTSRRHEICRSRNSI